MEATLPGALVDRDAQLVADPFDQPPELCHLATQRRDVGAIVR
jgi:hypothetical protein